MFLQWILEKKKKNRGYKLMFKSSYKYEHNKYKKEEAWASQIALCFLFFLSFIQNKRSPYFNSIYHLKLLSFSVSVFLFFNQKNKQIKQKLQVNPVTWSLVYWSTKQRTHVALTRRPNIVLLKYLTKKKESIISCIWELKTFIRM